MPPAPLTLSALLGVTATVGVVRLALDPDPFSADSAALVSMGLGVLTVVTIAGVLLARGRWSRWVAAALAGAWLVVVVVAELDLLGGALLLGAAAIAGTAAGPWLPRWLRHRPAAQGPPPAGALLLLTLIAAPAAVGLAEPTDAGVAGWIFSLWCLGLALGIGRALNPALWAGRILHGPAAAVCSVLLGLPGAIAISGLGVLHLALLWRRDVRLAVKPLLPGPSPAVPIPPELMDPTIMRAAGLDDRGRPMEES